MIDVESLVFDTVYNHIISLFPNANVTAGYDEQNAVFPTVIVRETNNQPYRASTTDACSENHARLTYEIEVISDKADEGRSECKTLLNAVDDIMTDGTKMKFRRVHKNRPINIDRTVWRQYARYEVIVGKGITTVTGIGDNAVETTTFQMYRR